ncbi:MAG: endo-1,4-beta-xylanase [Treponema sp.]|uniref:endo-1,4-beta-xylanase n=1 Tax=Treponema sp. TaxID=166 RepID=UPI00298DF012|nr:endo-1,4-beta-xylanase [Treponema sp.]MCR5387110.1 endo-1,4-beta-xylanase [Treponema sp.]
MKFKFLYLIMLLIIFSMANVFADSPKDWLDDEVPSLYKTYEKYFDYVGFGVEYGNFGSNWGTKKELNFSEVQKGLVKHANTITMGNEFKPQFIMAWWGKKPEVSGTFKASNGITIKTPVLKGLSRLDEILSICKANSLMMRGHVLVWHSQTEDAFFYEDYDTTKNLVGKDEMNARLEWYIKTVLEHVALWEKKNNGGKHIIWAWDVVNEATSDNSQPGAYESSYPEHWLRTAGTKWFDIYDSEEFIINAFAFANKYAPKDVKLCYNDYGGIYENRMSDKHESMLRVVDLLLKHKSDPLPTRIDVMGLQAHCNVKNGAAIFEKEIKDFILRGIDVHITELDIGTWNGYNPNTDAVKITGKQYKTLSAAYKDFFAMFIRNRKTEDKHGIECVTIWGLNDEATWLNSPSQRVWLGNCDQYPLFFTKKGKSYIPKKAFYAVIEAAEE